MKGLRLIIQISLVILAGVLAYLLYTSIMQPVRYEQVKSDREKLIIERLMHIKELQIEYKIIYGRYTSSFDTLKDFYLNGKMPVVLKAGSNDTLTEAEALKRGYIRRDTSYISINDTLLKTVENFNINLIDIVPFTNGQVKFELSAGTVDKSNFKVPVFMVKAYMKDYLKDVEQQDLLENDIIRLPELSKFPGLTLGSMDEPSTDGNWQF